MKPKQKSNSLVEFVNKRGHELPTNDAQPAAFKMREARSYLGGLSIPTMHRLVKRGLLRPNRSTRYLIFARSELDRFIRDGMT